MTLIEELDAAIEARAKNDTESITRHMRSKVIGLADGAVGLMDASLRAQVTAHASALAELLRPAVYEMVKSELSHRATINLLATPS